MQEESAATEPASVSPQPAPAPAAVREPREVPLQFTATGREYFGIWIVNLVLTILTVGIYSAWAKVRRLKYFYASTVLDGSAFDFHAKPLAILLGRAIALGLLLAYNLSAQFNLALFAVVLVVLAVVLPWLMRRSFRFRLAQSSHRNIRFRFTGGNGDAYLVFLLMPLVALFTLYLMLPAAHHQIKRYQHSNAWYGDLRFSFDASMGKFFKVYLLPFALGFLWLIGVVVAAVVLIAGAAKTGATSGQGTPPGFGMFMIVFLVSYLVFLLLVWPYFTAKLQNLVWNHTALGPHRFRSNVSVVKLAGIWISNLLLIIVTLGLYKPFAAVRMLKYRLGCVSLVLADDVHTVRARRDTGETATGEEAAEMFDIDIGL